MIALFMFATMLTDKELYETLQELHDETAISANECAFQNGQYLFGPRGTQGYSPIPYECAATQIKLHPKTLTARVRLYTEEKWNKYSPMFVRYQQQHPEVHVTMSDPIRKMIKTLKPEHEDEAKLIQEQNRLLRAQLEPLINQLKEMKVTFADDYGQECIQYPVRKIPNDWYEENFQNLYEWCSVTLNCHENTDLYKQFSALTSAN